jgi:hypothetical protein
MRPGWPKRLFGTWAQEGRRDHRRRKWRDGKAVDRDFRMGERETGGSLQQVGEPKKLAGDAMHLLDPDHDEGG